MKRFLAILLAVLILIPNQVIMAQPETVLNNLNSTRDVSYKMSADVLETELEKGTHDYLVQFNSSLILEKLPVEGQLLDQGMTQKQAKGVTTVQALKSEALKVQQPFVRQLEAAGVEFEAFYIANMMKIRGDYNLMEKLSYDPAVKGIYLDKMITLDVMDASVTPLSTGEAPVEWNIRQVNADKVWRDGITGQGVVVGVIDSGVDWQHPAIQRKWRAFDPENPSKPLADELAYSWFDAIKGEELPYDDNDHGTHVTGTILGQEANGENTVGVAPGAQWIAAKVFDSSGSGAASVMLRAGEWMLAPGGDATKAPHVINNSWGSGGGIDDWYRDIVRAWRTAGIIPVYAAGNQGLGEPVPGPGSIENPSNYPESFAVGAVNIENKLAPFSKLGPSPYDSRIFKPEMSAPGVAIRSSVIGGGYAAMDGTSMAAPHVAGVAALMLSANGNLSVDDVLDGIEKTATPLTDARYPNSPNMGYGHGLVNAFEAVNYVASGLGQIGGTVLVAGSDSEEPVVTLNPGPDFAFMDNDFVVEANAGDDVSVVLAELLYKWEGDEEFTKNEMILASGDEKAGTYTGYISKAPFFVKVEGAEFKGLREGEMTYKVRITDFAGNEVESEEFQTMISFGVTRDQWREDFQGDLSRWEFHGDWNVGTPGKYEPTPLFGDKLAGTMVGQYYYSDYTDSYLITPPIDLRDSSMEEATLKFRHFYEMATGGTVARIMITDNNGAEWLDLTPDFYTGKSDGWQADSVDLREYVGTEVPLYLAFIMTAGGYVDGAGWYLNEVELEGTDVTAPVPPTEIKVAQEIEGLNISWNSSFDGDAAIYEVFRQENEGEFSLLAETSKLSWLDETVKADVKYSYKVRARDYAKNIGEFSGVATGYKLNFDTLYFSDFEADNGGFTTEIIPLTNGETAVDSWEWGEVVEYGPKRAWSGDKLWATILAGDYLDNSSSRIMTPEISVPEMEGTIVLNFRHWYDGEKYRLIDSADDYGTLEISTDGGATFKTVPNGKWAGHIMTWEKGMFDLSDYKGQTIQLAFRFTSDKWSFGSETFMGWYLDDVGLYRVTDSDFTVSKTEAVQPGPVETEVEVNTSLAKTPGLLTELVGKTDDIEATAESAVTAIPVREARVEVVETGFSVAVSPASGRYFLRHPSIEGGRLRASAYGYYPETRTFSIVDEEESLEHFILNKIPRTSISGTLTDAITGEVIEGAQVRLIEDGRIDPVMSDASGKFMFTEIFEGEYTLHIYHPDFEITTHSLETTTAKPGVVELKMKPFVPYSTELGYDDGTAEDAVNMGQPGYGYGVVIDPQEFAHVNTIRAYFWGEDFPTPGGTEMKLVLYDVTDALIPMDKQLAEPMTVQVKRGEWNTFDISSLNIKRDKPFLAAFVQRHGPDDSPAIGVDYDTEVGNNRSYTVANGGFKSLKSIDFRGGWMIRAVVDYSMDVPQVTDVSKARKVEGNYYTNQNSVKINGRISGAGNVEVYRDGELYDTVTSKKTDFTASMRLNTGLNTVKVRGEAKGRYTSFSEDTPIILDQVLPMIHVTEPKVAVVTSKVLDVTGVVTEEYPDQFTVNGELVALNSDGSFKHSLILKNGINNLELKAVDLAGNTTIHPLQVDCQPVYDEPVAYDAKPSTSQNLYPGDKVSFQLSSNLVGGMAFWTLPEGLSGEMIEVAAGVYEAVWTVPEGLVLDGAKAELKVVKGKQSLKVNAPGSIFVRETGIRRFAGADRYKTATKVSEFAFTESDHVVLANGQSFADAMVGGVLAGSLEVPMLLTEKSTLPLETRKEMERLGVTELTIIGGTLAVSLDVEVELIKAGYKVNRLEGASRYATAAAVAQTITPKADTVYLASGESYADAMSFAPLAAQMRSSLLLTEKDSLSQASKTALLEMGAKNVVILGGELAVSLTVESQLQGMNLKTERVYGATRFETNLAIAQRFMNPATRGVVIASGETFADALTSAGFAAKAGQGLILVKKDEISKEAMTVLKGMNLKEITVLGGELRISDAVFNQLKNLLN